MNRQVSKRKRYKSNRYYKMDNEERERKVDREILRRKFISALLTVARPEQLIILLNYFYSE